MGQVHESAEGGAALTVLRQQWIDILICDWVMEPVDGFELTRMLRAATDVPNPMLPIIMMTGYTEAHRVLAARDAGITEMLAKALLGRQAVSATDCDHRISARLHS